MRPGKKILTYVVIFHRLAVCTFFIPYLSSPTTRPRWHQRPVHHDTIRLGIRVSIMNLLVNLPLALLVYKIVSRPVAIRPMIYSASFPWPWQFWSMCPWNNLPTPQKTEPAPSWAPLVAGIINGFCYSVVLRSGSEYRRA